MTNSQYYIQGFYQFAGYPKYNKYNNTYCGGCPICREGSSWGRKSRLYYMVEQDQIFCHNCGWNGTPLKWMIEVSGKSYDEIIQESRTIDVTSMVDRPKIERKETALLPDDSINLFDKSQVEYYKHEQVVKDAISFVVSRGLHRAVNKPESMYISLTDPVHKNRLCIPFYGTKGAVEHYQTRAIYDADMQDRPKYLSRVNSIKTLFNINRVDSTSENVYITEGPLDACFVNNGIAVAGIQERGHTLLTDKQKQQLGSLMLFRQIWCLDSQWLDSASHKKTSILIDQGKQVFIWPKTEGSKYKDFNDMCVGESINGIPESFIEQNTYNRMSAKVKFASVTL